MEVFGIIAVLIIALVIGKFLHDRNEQNISIAKEGGMLNKYKILIDHFMRGDSRTKIYKITSDYVSLGSSSIGGSTMFFLLQSFGKISIEWKSESEIFGKHNLEWNFNEYEEQEEMIERIENDLVKYQQDVMTSREFVDTISEKDFKTVAKKTLSLNVVGFKWYENPMIIKIGNREITYVCEVITTPVGSNDVSESGIFELTYAQFERISMDSIGMIDANKLKFLIDSKKVATVFKIDVTKNHMGLTWDNAKLILPDYSAGKLEENLRISTKEKELKKDYEETINKMLADKNFTFAMLTLEAYRNAFPKAKEAFTAYKIMIEDGKDEYLHLQEMQIENICGQVFQWFESLSESLIETFTEEIKHNKMEEAKFEAMIIFYFVAYRILYRDIEYAEKYADRLYEKLIAYSLEKNIAGKMEQSIDEFIFSNRFEMIENDLEKKSKDELWIMAQTIHSICYEPLKESITISNCFLNRKDLEIDIAFIVLPRFLLKSIDNFSASLEVITSDINGT